METAKSILRAFLVNMRLGTVKLGELERTARMICVTTQTVRLSETLRDTSGTMGIVKLVVGGAALAGFSAAIGALSANMAKQTFEEVQKSGVIVRVAATLLLPSISFMTIRMLVKTTKQTLSVTVGVELSENTQSAMVIIGNEAFKATMNCPPVTTSWLFIAVTGAAVAGTIATVNKISMVNVHKTGQLANKVAFAAYVARTVSFLRAQRKAK